MWFPKILKCYIYNIYYYKEEITRRRDDSTPVPQDDDVIDKKWTSAPYHPLQHDRMLDAVSCVPTT